jgi:hypothetical protein
MRKTLVIWVSAVVIAAASCSVAPRTAQASNVSYNYVFTSDASITFDDLTGPLSITGGFTWNTPGETITNIDVALGGHPFTTDAGSDASQLRLTEGGGATLFLFFLPNLDSGGPSSLTLLGCCGSFFQNDDGIEFASAIEGGVDVASTPLPAGLPLFATGLGAMGLFGWRRKRKNAAALTA